MDKDHHNEKETVSLLKELTIQDFLDIGLNQVAYIKHIEEGSDGYYSIHAADGSQLSIMDSYDAAIAAVRVDDLFPVTVH